MKVVLFQSLYAGLIATYAAMVVAWTWAIGQLRSGRSLFPSVKPRVVPWGAASTGAVIVAWIFARLLAADVFFAFTNRARSVPLSFLELMTLASLWSWLVVVMVPVVMGLTSRASLADLGLERRGFLRQTLVGAVAFLLVSVPIYLINFLCVALTSLVTRAWEPNKHPVEKMVRENFSGEVAYLAVLSAVVLAPAAEELIFRGVVQSWLYKMIRALFTPPSGSADAGRQPGSTVIEVPLEADLNARTDSAPPTFADTAAVGEKPDRNDRRAEWMAIVFTSLLFALAHWEQWPAPVAIFFLSVTLGFVFQRTGSLWSSIVLHSLFNGLSTAVLFWSILGSAPPAKNGEPDRAPVKTLAPASPGPPKSAAHPARGA